MQAWVWTVEGAAMVAALLGVGFGALTIAVLKGRRVTALATAVDWLKQQLEESQQQYFLAQEEIKRLQIHTHEQDLQINTLRVQSGNAQTEMARLEKELQEQLHQYRLQQKLLEEAQAHAHNAQVKLEASQTQLQAAQEQSQELRARLKDTEHNLGEKLHSLQEQHSAVNRQYTELKTTLEQKELNFSAQLAQLNETKMQMGKEFENLANKIFEEKGKTFSQTSQSSIDALLKPFREQVQGFQNRINEVHDAALKGNTALNLEIKKVFEIGIKMSQEATDLTRALKGDSQQRGAWGEAQLERTLEMSGLIKDEHFSAQTSFKDEHGQTKRTDYLIKLPDHKHIVIDSKVSLVAYDKAVNASSEEGQQLALAEHAKAVRRHIDDLASKDYTSLAGVRSPAFVLMFMPIEPAYIEVLKYERDLFDYGYRKGVVLVSHTTLIPILRTVSNLWMIDRSNSEAREISEKAGDIFNQICIVAEHLNRLGGTLNTASNHYNKAITSFTGAKGLYSKVERFNQLSNKVSKELPALEPIQLDYHTERLNLIAEPIQEQADTLASDEEQALPE
ncbi:MAG: exported protein [Pseudomonadota bacterium]|jgi:DNA recombination protein RmuC